MADDKDPTMAPEGCSGCPKENMSESRRTLMRRLGWGAFFTTLTVSAAGTLRFFFPRVLFEPPTKFKIGTMEDYPTGTADKYGVIAVSEQFMEKQRVWIVRETDKVYAIFGKCTHLGCTPKWFPDERQFKCPCHGSQYYSNGVNFAGPAPRPMDRYAISKLGDGRIVVDKSELFTVDQFEDPRCFLKA